MWQWLHAHMLSTHAETVCVSISLKLAHLHGAVYSVPVKLLSKVWKHASHWKYQWLRYAVWFSVTTSSIHSQSRWVVYLFWFWIEVSQLDVPGGIVIRSPNQLRWPLWTRRSRSSAPRSLRMSSSCPALTSAISFFLSIPRAHRSQLGVGT